MGCSHSKKKSKSKKAEKSRKGESQRDDGGQRTSAGPDVCLVKQVERFEWQQRILKEVLSANGNSERAELLKEHADVEVCALVASIFDKVKTETAADLNVLNEHRRKCLTEEHERHVEELQQKHQQEKTELTEKSRAQENILKGEAERLTVQLQVYEELKRRVAESKFKKDLQRNNQAQGSPGEFWESELESLLFVIEMKSERVEELLRKLQRMDELVTDNLSLDKQLNRVRQQNEDLRVQLDNCQTFMQQLSREQQEQQDLKVALQRQAAANQRLSQENEQLLFKLRHQDPCPSIHLPAIVQDIGPR